MSTPLPEDVRDLLDLLDQAASEYLVVGAHAVAAHGAPRYTGDFDILIRPDPTNADRVMRALRMFGARVDAHGLTVEDLAKEGTLYQLGLPPRRIDLLTQISGVTFAEAWKDRFMATLDGRELAVLGVQTLVRNKRSTGRTKDLLDVELLREAGVDVDG